MDESPLKYLPLNKRDSHDISIEDRETALKYFDRIPHIGRFDFHYDKKFLE